MTALIRQALARLSEAMAVAIPPRILFRKPTVADLASKVASMHETPSLQKERGIIEERSKARAHQPPGQEVYEFPLSFAQQRLWFLDRFEGGGAAYHMARAVRLCGELNRDALEQALREIVARHESLRTHFAELNGQPVQVVVPALKIALPIEDLSALEDRARETAIAAVLVRELEKPFKLSQGPLLRMTLVKLSEREHLLLRTFHHIVSDGWSVGVFNRELSALYAAFCKGRRSPLESLPIQYPDYAVWQRQFLQGAELDRQLGYWHAQLAAAPTLELATDRPRPAKLTYAGARHAFTLSPSLSARIKDFNQRNNLTPFMSLLATFQVLLARYSGQDDILVGTPIANRQRSQLE
ncbi:MAG: non-ribosomal peptide synthetase, partial [Acidobacteria bacterium]